MNHPDLGTERLFLRTPVETDIAAIIDIVGQWDVARCLSHVPHPYDEDDVRYFIEDVASVEMRLERSAFR